MTSVSLVVEGVCDERAMRKIATGIGFAVHVAHNCRGKSKLDMRLPGYLLAAEHGPWVVLRDLDQDAPCAPKFLTDRGLVIPPLACVRLAVRSLEAWLLADRKTIAEYLGVSQSLIPQAPENEQHPKRKMAELAGRSKRRTIRERMAARPENGALYGPEYEAALMEFIDQHWNYQTASERSPSLARAIAKIDALYVLAAAPH